MTKSNQYATVLSYLEAAHRGCMSSAKTWTEHAATSREEAEQLRRLIAEATGKSYVPAPVPAAEEAAQLTEKLLKTEADVRARELTITELRARIEVLNKEKCAAEGVAESWKAEFHRLKEWALIRWVK